MKKANLIKQWKEDEKALFEGWDFSYIKNRWIVEDPNWNYKKIAKKLVKSSESVLDMETGGGEIFSEILASSKPKKIKAFEGYHPNVAVAKKNLEPLGVKVFEVNGIPFPFKKREFDLVINRHGAINKKIIKEINRVLKKGGMFLTQQVETYNLSDLREVFNERIKWKTNVLSEVKKNLIKNDFEIIESAEWEGKYIFKDVGAIIYFLKYIPWIIDNFSVEKHKSVLFELQKRLEKNGSLKFKQRLFYILSKKLK